MDVISQTTGPGMRRGVFMKSNNSLFYVRNAPASYRGHNILLSRLQMFQMKEILKGIMWRVK
jgi:hypothetical protein